MFTHRKVKTLGLFDKRIDGDDSLMELARLRFRASNMGTEMHPATPEQLELLMKIRPSDDTVVVAHLARDFDLADEASRSRVMEFATRFAGRVYGLVIHDHPTMAKRRECYVEAAWEMESRLGKIVDSPMLFVEYAVGLEPAEFVRFFASIQDLDRVNACIDIGHIGIRRAQVFYAQLHPGEDVCSLRSQSPRLPHVMAGVEASVRSGALAVLEVIDAIAALKKPVHFHLHDAHPLSTFSPFGVSDHLSFFAEIPLNFDYHGQRMVAPMFGPDGLSRIVHRAVETIGPRGLSFTLEIHPTNERLPVGDADALFNHWSDKANAERMNHWLSVLAQNHTLLREAIQAVSPPVPSEPVVPPVFDTPSPPASPEATPRLPVEEPAPAVSCGFDSQPPTIAAPLPATGGGKPKELTQEALSLASAGPSTQPPPVTDTTPPEKTGEARALSRNSGTCSQPAKKRPPSPKPDEVTARQPLEGNPAPTPLETQPSSLKPQLP